MESYVNAAEAILKSDFSLLMVLVLIIMTLGFVIRHLFKVNQSMADNQTEALRGVTNEMEENRKVNKRVVKLLMLSAQDRLEGTGINLETFFDD